MPETFQDPVSAPSALNEALQALGDITFDVLRKADPSVKGVVSPKASAAAIILAGGSGERFGHEGGKQLVEIAGMPILTRSAKAFDAAPDVGLIVIVCPEDRTSEYFTRAIDPYEFVTPIVMAPAGSIRQESAFSGLELVPEEYDFVMLHDGARPLISPELIQHTLNTLKVVENGVIVGTPDRSVFWNAQTPQVFRAGIYRRAHAAALSDGFVGTDDSALIERLGGHVLVVEGSRDNIKLTVP